eukprot:TRINITY_DN440_c0_g2_i13.p1 TRINITY_DN440_c0_g2~~TRINITY_DN440_c0_g2_i13.p1  ORF type:complete len:321 (-),score=102.97 TRINITY_DN440_c0_g2_i13:358-1320(-)
MNVVRVFLALVLAFLVVATPLRAVSVGKCPGGNCHREGNKGTNLVEEYAGAGVSVVRDTASQGDATTTTTTSTDTTGTSAASDMVPQQTRAPPGPDEAPSLDPKRAQQIYRETRKEGSIRVNQAHVAQERSKAESSLEAKTTELSNTESKILNERDLVNRMTEEERAMRAKQSMATSHQMQAQQERLAAKQAIIDQDSRIAQARNEIARQSAVLEKLRLQELNLQAKLKELMTQQQTLGHTEKDLNTQANDKIAEEGHAAQELAQVKADVSRDKAVARTEEQKASAAAKREIAEKAKSERGALEAQNLKTIKDSVSIARR